MSGSLLILFLIGSAGAKSSLDVGIKSAGKEVDVGFENTGSKVDGSMLNVFNILSGCCDSTGKPTPPTTTTTTTTVPAIDPYVMVIGGTAGSDRVEVLSLDPINDPIKNCTRHRNRFPTGFVGGAAATLMDPSGLPVVCGGSPFTSGCYIYNPPVDSWTKTNASFSGFSYTSRGVQDPDLGLVLVGNTKIVQHTTDGTTFKALASSPFSGADTCLVSIDSNRIAMIGGKLPLTAQTAIYSKSMNKWTLMANMSRPRAGMNCGLVKNKATGKLEIVAAGGDCSNGGRHSMVEIYTIDDDKWRSANKMPEEIDDATVVQFRDTFVIVGGFSNGTVSRLDTLYKYVPATDGWQLLNTTLSEGKEYHVTTLVDRNMFPYC